MRVRGEGAAIKPTDLEALRMGEKKFAAAQKREEIKAKALKRREKIRGTIMNLFSQSQLLQNESRETKIYLNGVVIKKNYRSLIPCAVATVIVTLINIISSLFGGYYATAFPCSILDIIAEALCIVAGVGYMVYVSRHSERPAVQNEQRIAGIVFLSLTSLAFSLFSLSDVVRNETIGVHFFALIIIAVMPILTANEFIIYYYIIYASPSLLYSLVNGRLNFLTIAMYMAACLLHSVIKTDFTRAELNRMYLERLSKEMSEMSMTDSLTQVGNRERFFNYMRANTEKWLANHTEMCLVMIDIDKFKNYNDTYSHLKGDECLVKVAKTISSTLDTFVTTDKIFIRFGGEEFMFLIAGKDVKSTLLNVYPKIRANIADLKLLSGDGVDSKYVTISMGAHVFNFGEETVMEEELKIADLQLYMTKTHGRDGLGFKNYIYRDSTIPPEYIEKEVKEGA